ncbi:hypothetical protein KPH14_009519 [Odynerus spinipes]|uniref:LIM zinc-binding domain-containing protein n=1 Tax=Odynerus spinipes TaxID=1348599 RepID=A0AAD9RPI6_9HYME|nr:hypothetical protein KPH14_009519 [Odynerus spinipes]
MQNDREASLADRTRSRNAENCFHADILTIRSSEDVRRSEEDLRDEGSVNYSESVSLAQTPCHDDKIVPANNEDDIMDENTPICNHKNLQDCRNYIQDDDVDDNDDRMRGGHGEHTCCGSRKTEGCCASKPVNEECGCSSSQNPENNVCGYRGIESRRRFLRSESCPPREFELCQDDHKSAPCKTAACSPLCADRRGCCPPAGCRPVCTKPRRSCCSPCKGETQGCGGGGCCGSGCRGGCGKPGQTCMPARPCSTPPCRPCPPFGGSPCAPPRACPPTPGCCRPPSRGGCCAGGGGPSYCRSTSPPCRSIHSGGCYFDDRTCCDIDGAESCCRAKVPPGCECLGGGLDCQRCGRKVYQAEMQIVSGVPYHNICFSCFCCRKPLEPLTYQENCGEIYCKQCYIRNFGPQGYGYGVGAGALQTPM